MVPMVAITASRRDAHALVINASDLHWYSTLMSTHNLIKHAQLLDKTNEVVRQLMLQRLTDGPNICLWSLTQHLLGKAAKSCATDIIIISCG